MEELYPFFLILFAAVFFSFIFKRFNVPWVISLIIAGIIIGPHGFGLFELNPTIDFIGGLGLVFLMFMAGLQIKLSSLKAERKDVSILALLNGLIPFGVGVGIGLFFGFTLTTSLLLGIIFISSSIALIIPSLESRGLINTRVGRSIVSATMFEDAASLVLLSILLQIISPITQLPLPVFYVLLFFALVGLRWLLPRLNDLFIEQGGSKEEKFTQELRIVVVILLGTVVVFDYIGLHPIIAGFFAGLVLSDTIKHEQLNDKIRTIGYGIFIPTFFILVGARADVSVFLRTEGVLLLALVVVIGSVVSKFGSGWIGGKLIGFSNQESSLIGSATIPQLSTTLAVVFAGVELGVVPDELVTVMIILSIVTVFLAPTLTTFIMKRMERKPRTLLK